MLRSPDLRSALGFAADVAGCDGIDEMRRHIKRLPALIGSDTVLMGEVHLAGETAVLTADDGPTGAYDDETRAVFMRLWHQHPVVRRHFGGPTDGAMKISDFLTDRRWRNTELFDQCYGGRLGLGWELSVQLQTGAGRQACVAMGRTDRDFTERDRAFLNAVNPHLRAGYARLEHQAERERRMALLERGIEARGDVLVIVDRRGRIVAAGASAVATMHRWFGEADVPAKLPAAVEAWRRTERRSAHPARLSARHADRLRLRLVAGAREDAILITERCTSAWDAALLARRLGISRREAEVLTLLAQGHMNAAIAIELHLSPNTVGRYIERVYAKLDVHNRAEATGAVRDALDD